MSWFLLNRNLTLLEPYDWKLSCTVLRGERGSNAPDLPGDAKGQPYYDYAYYNTGRLPKFAQLDLRVDKSFYFHHCMIGIYLDIQNITGNKLKQPDVIMSTGIIENPSAPVAEQRYKMKYLKQESGTILPTLGITVEF